MNRVRILDRGNDLGAIVSVGLEGLDPRDVMRRLREKGINTSAQIRAYAVIDYDQKGASSSLRISPHYYNTDEEVEQVIEAIKQVVQTS